MSEAPFTMSKEQLLVEIERAFANVTREGGMSWSDSWESDGGPASDCPLYPDVDTNWTELIDDERWNPCGWGGFSFLDPIGFRYYLPVALYRTVRQGCNEYIVFHLDADQDLSSYAKTMAGCDFDRAQFVEEKLSALNANQLTCIIYVALYIQTLRRADIEATKAMPGWTSATPEEQELMLCNFDDDQWAGALSTARRLLARQSGP